MDSYVNSLDSFFKTDQRPCCSMHRNLRRNALEKLAALSAQSTTAHNDGRDDVARLCELRQKYARDQSPGTSNGPTDGETKHMRTSQVPMSHRELEVLVALCKAAPLVHTTRDAKLLVRQLGAYVPEVHRQSFVPFPTYQSLPPWETLAFDLTSGVLALGLNHQSLRPEVLQYTERATEDLRKSAEQCAWMDSDNAGEDATIQPPLEQALSLIQLTVSLLGFLTATAEYVQLWDTQQRVAMVQRLRDLLSEKLMVSVEGALSAVRNSRSHVRRIKEWKRWIRQYAVRGTPLGAILLQRAFMKVVERSAILLIPSREPLRPHSFLDDLVDHNTLSEPDGQTDEDTLEDLTDTIVDQVNFIEADSDYLQVSSAWQQRLALEVKASCMRSYLCCTLVNETVADDDLLMAWFEAIVSDAVQMADATLAQTVLKSMAILSRTSPAIASNLNRSMPRLLLQGKLPPNTARVAGHCLAVVLQQLPSDVVISTLYSLGNVLSSNKSNEKPTGALALDGASFSGSGSPFYPQLVLGSQLSLVVSDEEETSAVYGSVIQAIVAIAVACRDEKMTSLVVSMLVQKTGRISPGVDARVVVELAALGPCSNRLQFNMLLRLYSRIAGDAMAKRDDLLVNAITDARLRLAMWIRKDSHLYEPYLTHLLEIAVSCGDTGGDFTPDKTLAARTIELLLRPLAILVSKEPDGPPEFENHDELLQLNRDAWFNFVAHGFTLESLAVNEHAETIQILARHSWSLVDEERADVRESSIDLDGVLRRGVSSARTVELKSALISSLPQCESDIKGLSPPDAVFLNAALLISIMAARAGDCTPVLSYFAENKVKKTAMGTVMLAIAVKSVETYLQRALTGHRQEFAAPQVALQLASFFQGACHRFPSVQQAAVSCADQIVNVVPSALCQKASLFALLELLTIMWKSCLDAETDEYGWKVMYQSGTGGISVQASDDVKLRQDVLVRFHQRCKQWVSRAVDVAPMDVKSLLQAYLENYEDDGAYERIALGRSFAVEMGAAIPSTNQWLASIGRQSIVGVNTASDFIAQYTTRQEYRRVGPNVVPDEAWNLIEREDPTHSIVVESLPWKQGKTARLRSLSQRLGRGEKVAFAEVKETLRNAAGVLSRSFGDQSTLLADLVSVPFAIFTKQAINLGISLWLGVVNENPQFASRVLAEVANGWIWSIRLRKGFFDCSPRHSDPFHTKAEFAPTRWDDIRRQQERIQNLLAPHLRLTRLLSSHFSASQLVAPSIERLYGRVMRITMLAMRQTLVHPLAREVHFQMVHLALRVLRYNTQTTPSSIWRMKDAILSAALVWFANPPFWSFGSNKLQVKAEVKLLNDVIAMLKKVEFLGARPTETLGSLQAKQDLLTLLLTQEVSRLGVWIAPEDDATTTTDAVADTAFLPLLETAWAEDPRIAVQLATRYPDSSTLATEIRLLIQREPERAISDCNALPVLLGASLTSDVGMQLKHLLFWAPVDPMTAATYFLPTYKHDPFLINYAVRALESHSVDVTFFYVPQIVQTLRYDALGYVERYIIETGRTSQLFAHQIIWNMKANAYKDEDSQEPDALKPTLDRVMGAMVSSFSAEDQDFYHREFDFFGKITGISGTLKPFIKAPKAEKKQKIEEELRKIQVEVGVYLPSNPEGVVVGIDRKSGKPLQSHAKAPFMATFRIRKDDVPTEDEADAPMARHDEAPRPASHEVWQSAIFKVGDDCRQDVLALQMIAAFRSIFNHVGLDVFVFPYRVTATAPGCGVIDVLPQSISRDMLGREAVNGLYEYFLSKYGPEDSRRFQEARSNFIKSMAAYSIISFLLQFKDRHNGNLMVDDAGHLLHIDFGFCFDVVPGGVRFERAPFKLTPEMVAVMGGGAHGHGPASQSFRAFEDLCVKAFLAVRPHADRLAHLVRAMLDSGLPCFRAQTLRHFRDRFVLDRDDRRAAAFVRHLVRVSERSYSTGVYDYYQLLTNGIPY